MDGTELYTWEYWEAKFNGMSDEEINNYWRRQMQISEDPILDELDDDGFDSGIRAKMVMENYQKYIAAKKRHEKEQLGEEIGD